jgi:hypothetical protein
MTVPPTPTQPRKQTPLARALPALSFGLCGASGSGKTTFLTSLSLAVAAAQKQGLGDWSMVGAGPEATRFIEDGERDLVEHRRFPPATATPVTLRWHLWGPDVPTLFGSKKINFTLDVDDVPGVNFLPDAISDEMVARLAYADAMVFIVDPVLERRRTDSEQSNWSYIRSLINRMAEQHPGLLQKGKLRHHVAVCLSKFDDPQIFRAAFEEGLVDVMPGEQPVVPADRAGEYFAWICRWIEESREAGSTQLLRDALEGRFVRDRVRYFATSSVGFWRRVGQDFDIRDYLNIETVDGKHRLRGPVRPVNVLEPFIDLTARIRKVKL